MADPFTNAINSVIANLSIGNPITFVMGLFISTIIGGIILIILLKVADEDLHPGHSFLLVLIINLIINLGVVSLLGSFFVYIPFGSYIVFILPVIIWLALLKALFSEMHTGHLLMIGIAGYIVTYWAVPYLMASFITPYLPTFNLF